MPKLSDTSYGFNTLARAFAPDRSFSVRAIRASVRAMIDHLTLRVESYDASKQFYLAALAPLGYALVMEFELPGIGKFCGLGVDGKPDLWLAPVEPGRPSPRGQHIAFRARKRSDVDAFHRAALQAGARDDGGPGKREQYHPNYYGAFAIDPNGIYIEACTHHAE